MLFLHPKVYILHFISDSKLSYQYLNSSLYICMAIPAIPSLTDATQIPTFSHCSNMLVNICYDLLHDDLSYISLFLLDIAFIGQTNILFKYQISILTSNNKHSLYYRHQIHKVYDPQTMLHNCFFFQGNIPSLNILF